MQLKTGQLTSLAARCLLDESEARVEPDRVRDAGRMTNPAHMPALDFRMPAIVTSDLPRPMNHVFVDFENVRHVDFSLIGAKAVSFTLLLGARNTKLDVPLVEKLMEHAASVQLVRQTSSGRNALDFALSYYLGRAVLADPTAYFHVVSGDKGFDPLIEHLRSRHVHARRHDDFTTLTFSGPVKAPVAPNVPTAAKAPTVPPEDLMTRVLEQLRRNIANRPKRKSTLISHLRAFAGKTATEADAVKLVEALREAGHISFSEKDAVTYHV